MINQKDITIYCVYHNNELIDEYNLNYIPDYIKLFNANDLNMPGENINYLNPHLCELVAYYYIWKNNIYSPYVGFCHYRRWYKNLGFDNIEKCGAHYYGYCNIDLSNYLNNPEISGNMMLCGGDNLTKINEFNQFKKYLYNSNKIDKHILDKYFSLDNDERLHTPWTLQYILKWEYFCDVCELCFGWLENLLPNYKSEESYKDTGRSYAWKFEIYFGIIVALYLNNPAINNNNWRVYDQSALYTKSNDIYKIYKWIKKNNRTQTNIYVETEIEKIYEFVNIIKDISEIPSDQPVIKLNIDEYVKCLDPINFLKGKYTIEKIKEEEA